MLEKYSATSHRRRSSSRTNTPAVMEQLEGRLLMKVVVVTTPLDEPTAGTRLTSLRDAITIANASTTPTVIAFAPAIFAVKPKLITLNGSKLAFTHGATTIIAPARGVSISGNGQSRILDIAIGVGVRLFRLNLFNSNQNAINN